MPLNKETKSNQCWQKLLFISPIWPLDAVWKSRKEQLLIGIGDERNSKESMLLTYLHDDDDTN